MLGKGAFEAMLTSAPELAGVFQAANTKRNFKRLRSLIQLAVERSECSTQRLRPGETLFVQGEPAEAFFQVQSVTRPMSRSPAYP